MITRRTLLKSLVFGAGGLALNRQRSAYATQSGADFWYMPDESAPHQRTWMAFGASERIWGKRLLPEVQRNLAEIANTIATFEPVSLLVRPSELAQVRSLVRANVDLVPCPLDDLWIRDTGPVFVINNQGEKAGVDFNFNGWGEKQSFVQDQNVAGFVCARAGAPRLATGLVMEGGGVEVDGHGTAILTESCVLNDNRNPGLSKSECEQELKRLLGLHQILWLPGIRGMDITDGHTDFYARFVEPGVVVAAYDPDPYSFDHAVTKEHLKILRSAKGRDGKPLQVVVLEAPAKVRPTYANDEFAAGYINFYVCNGAVIVPEFGDANADGKALSALQKLFPGRKVIALNIDGIAAGGGGIHCATQQEPLAEREALR